MAHFCAAATAPSDRSAWCIIPPPLTIGVSPPDVTAGPTDAELHAAETAAGQIEAIAAASQDRLADLTLSRIERIEREEGLALDRLRKLGEAKNVDAAEVEAANLV